MLKCLNIDSLVVKNNIRKISKSDESFKQLCSSIKLEGLLTALTVKEIGDNKYEILAGHRRYEALKTLGEQLVECNIIDNVEDEKDVIRVQLAENIHRENMTPFEYVSIFNKLKENYGMDNTRIALFLNKSIAWVNDQYFASKYLKDKYGDIDDIPSDIKHKAASTIRAYSLKGTNEEKIKKISDDCDVERKRHCYRISCKTNEFENKLLEFLKENNIDF